jgi:hypothetical protein
MGVAVVVGVTVCAVEPLTRNKTSSPTKGSIASADCSDIMNTDAYSNNYCDSFLQCLLKGGDRAVVSGTAPEQHNGRTLLQKLHE